MRIPDAYNAGFGQKVTPVTPSVMPDGSGDQMVAAAGEKFSGTLLTTATDDLSYKRDMADAQTRMEQSEAYRQQRESEAEQKALDKLKAHSAAELQLQNMGDLLSKKSEFLATSPLFDDDEAKRSAFTDTANRLRQEFLDNVPDPSLQAQLVPHLASIQMTADRKFSETLKTNTAKTIQVNEDAAFFNIKNSAKPLEQKIQDINTASLNTYDEGTQGVMRRQARDEASQLDIENRIETTRDNIGSLQKLKQELNAKDATGEQYSSYVYLDSKQRGHQIKAIDDRIKTAVAQEQYRQEKQKTEARQLAGELIGEFERRIDTGWWPQNNKADNSYMKQVASASSLSAPLNRRYEDAVTKMNDFSFREQIRTKNPLGVAAAEQGKKLSAINFNDPSSVTRRILDMQSLGQKIPLQGPEIEHLTEHLNTMTPQALTTYVKDFNTALGPQVGGALFSLAGDQIRIKDPSMSTVFKLVSQDKGDAARLYAEGRQFLKTEGKDFFKEKVKFKDDLDAEIETSLGRAISSMPASRNATKDAIGVAYLGAARQRSLPMDKVNNDLLHEVTRQVIGATAVTGSQWGTPTWGEASAVNSWKTTIVPDGWTADQFTNKIKQIKPEDVAQRGGIQGMSDTDAAAFLRTHAWHETQGEGYMFFNENRRAAMGKNNKPFVWNW